jgi:hypothetical protein
LLTLVAHTLFLEVNFNFQLVSEQAHSVERIYFLSVILISCDFYFFNYTFIMDFSRLSEENHDIELSKVFAKIDKIVSPKELKKVKQEKESLIV